MIKDVTHTLDKAFIYPHCVCTMLKLKTVCDKSIVYQKNIAADRSSGSVLLFRDNQELFAHIKYSVGERDYTNVEISAAPRSPKEYIAINDMLFRDVFHGRELFEWFFPDTVQPERDDVTLVHDQLQLEVLSDIFNRTLRATAFPIAAFDPDENPHEINMMTREEAVAHYQAKIDAVNAIFCHNGTPQLESEPILAQTPEVYELISQTLSESHGETVIIEISLRTKRFKLNGTGSDGDNLPLVGISDSETDEIIGDIMFPNRPNWTIVSASTSKSAITVVLRKP